MAQANSLASGNVFKTLKHHSVITACRDIHWSMCLLEQQVHTPVDISTRNRSACSDIGSTSIWSLAWRQLDIRNLNFDVCHRRLDVIKSNPDLTGLCLRRSDDNRFPVGLCRLCPIVTFLGDWQLVQFPEIRQSRFVSSLYSSLHSATCTWWVTCTSTCTCEI